MRETVRSLKTYLVLVGLWRTFTLVYALATFETWTRVDVAVLFIYGGLGLWFLIAGFKLRAWLGENIRPVLALLVADIAFSVLLVLVGSAADNIVGSVISVLICAYLWHNIKRLDAQTPGRRVADVFD